MPGLAIPWDSGLPGASQPSSLQTASTLAGAGASGVSASKLSVVAVGSTVVLVSVLWGLTPDSDVPAGEPAEEPAAVSEASHEPALPTVPAATATGSVRTRLVSDQALAATPTCDLTVDLRVDGQPAPAGVLVELFPVAGLDLIHVQQMLVRRPPCADGAIVEWQSGRTYSRVDYFLWSNGCRWPC